MPAAAAAGRGSRHEPRGFRMTARRPGARVRGLVGVLALAVAGSGMVGSVAPAEADPAAGVSSTGSATTTGVGSGRAAASRGSAGVGDAYFPQYGNGGYRVRHYDVDVSFDPATERLRGRTVVNARATQRLSRFNLDFVLPVSRVLVNGRRAHRRSTAHELVVTPTRPVPRGAPMRVVVRYAGVPKNERVGGTRSPWVTTRDGAAAIGEPEIAAWWFPSNDHPSDKASFGITLRVPRGVEAISNGRLLSRRNRGDRTVWRWHEDDPMATYLAFAAIGQFDIVRGRTRTGRPFLYAYSQLIREQRAARRSVGATAAITAWLERVWGPYPYDEIGGVVLGKWVGFALENQTRPVYSRAFFAFGKDRRVVAHEMAHQWFGDKVALERWRHIWLNEGFATYTEWLYANHARHVPVAGSFERTYRDYRPRSHFWDVKVADPGRGRLFSAPIYERGAMTAHALRNRIGSARFFTLMRAWVRANDGDGTTGELIAMAERISGQQLDGFFDAWLFTKARPRPTVANGFPRDF
jgi:aminopeptidase N